MAIQATVGTRQAMRPYTPISLPDSVGFFDLLVKTYPSGTISVFLAEMKVGEYADFKGPRGTFEYALNAYKSIGMIAGGTGITPMYQVIRHILEDPADKTSVGLIYANDNEDDILLRKELEALAAEHPDRFKIWYTLANPPSKWAYDTGFVTPDMIAKHCPKPGPRTKIMMCGPPPMTAAMRGHCEKMGFSDEMMSRF